MEIIDKGGKKPITVWLTNEEQKHTDLKQLSSQIRKKSNDPNRKVAFFLSGKNDLYEATENLLLNNVKNR